MNFHKKSCIMAYRLLPSFQWVCALAGTCTEREHGTGTAHVSGGSEWPWIFDTLHRGTFRIAAHQGARLFFQQATARSLWTVLPFEPPAAALWGQSLETRAAGRWSKAVQNMESVYSLELFICGSSCLLLSEACMPLSPLRHVGILNRTESSIFRTYYTYLFCFSSCRKTAI